jgi:serine protease AprX
VAGILGGNGDASDGFYLGIAPKVDLINLKVSDDFGQAYESDVVAAMQWVYDNKEQYNIRVVNMSINSTVASSYHNSPMSAAAEILWFNGVVVVVSAGNYWSDYDFNPVLAAPANDPFLITVGGTDEKGTTRINDDVIGNFSAFGTTLDGHFKPEIYAPGKNIISVLATSSTWDETHPDRVVLDGEYFRLSGTSMSAPMVAGAAALLLQAEPDLTPDQVKYRLINSAGWIGPGKYLDVFAAITTPTTNSANTDIEASQLLWTGDEPVVWGSVAWNSVAWNSVAWNSVAWNSVAWNSVAWNSVAWND